MLTQVNASGATVTQGMIMQFSPITIQQYTDCAT